MHQIHGMRLPNRTLWTAATELSSPCRQKGLEVTTELRHQHIDSEKGGTEKRKERDITMAAVPVRLTDAKRYCLT
ncbi:hypothetical protein CEXT_96641 [Caerostris extrusa]|uniref:Uncharacterized protein n=1 Tax=Caerostris extrusa TaxID=172846 RepID=A0AAV4RKG4_CAEEX|nr:hypothetical protein CEXT_96641 [Caerostris extrusa]